MTQGIGVAAIYMGLNALLLLALAYNVGSRRGSQNQLQPGDMGDATLTRSIRAHANFAEHAPTVLLLLLLMALLGFKSAWLHAYGAIFTIGRIVGAVGMMQNIHPNALRFSGNLVTGLALLVGGGAVIACGLGMVV